LMNIEAFLAEDSTLCLCDLPSFAAQAAPRHQDSCR
jgi:hypothetical protein